jgi:hypothetical protein
MVRKYGCVLTDMFILDVMMGTSAAKSISCFRIGKKHPTGHKPSDKDHLHGGCCPDAHEFATSVYFARLQVWNLGKLGLRVVDGDPEIVKIKAPQYLPALMQYRDFPVAVNVFDGERLFISNIHSIWARRCSVDLGIAARRINSFMDSSDERVREVLRKTAEVLKQLGFTIQFYDSDKIFEELYPTNAA